MEGKCILGQGKAHAMSRERDSSVCVAGAHRRVRPRGLGLCTEDTGCSTRRRKPAVSEKPSRAGGPIGREQVGDVALAAGGGRDMCNADGCGSHTGLQNNSQTCRGDRFGPEELVLPNPDAGGGPARVYRGQWQTQTDAQSHRHPSFKSRCVGGAAVPGSEQF